jgi:acetylornithine aminotransferase
MKLQDCIWNLQGLKFVSSLKFSGYSAPTWNFKFIPKPKIKWTFDVYPLYPITPVKSIRLYHYRRQNWIFRPILWARGNFYWSRSRLRCKIKAQLDNSFYSNAIQNPLQVELADKLGKLSGYTVTACFVQFWGWSQWKCAKMASFHTNKSE